jgi:di/tricarboxylate transporter
MVTESGDLVILAVQRGGEDQGSGTTVLVAGDTLLLQGTWDALSSNTIDPDVIVVDTPDTIRRQAAPLGSKAKVALIVLAGMVVLLATGIVPPVIAGAAAAIAMVLFRVVTVEQAHRSMSWTTLILIGAMIPLSVAITDTGAAKLIANGMVDLLGDYGPHVLLLAIVLFTVVLGQLISNTATALIVVPIALSIGAEFNVSVLPLLMGVTVAAAASFMTPIATPANLMVMGPGGYKFGDYWKFGLPLLLFSVLVATLLVPVIWPF